MYNYYSTYPVIMQSNIIWVDSESEARDKAKLLSPGITIIMLDNNRPVAYKGSADLSGKILPVEVYRLAAEEVEEKEEPHQITMDEYLTRKEFDSFKNSVEQRLSHLKRKGDKQ